MIRVLRDVKEDFELWRGLICMDAQDVQDGVSKPPCVPPWSSRGRVWHPPSPLALREGGGIRVLPLGHQGGGGSRRGGGSSLRSE